MHDVASLKAIGDDAASMGKDYCLTAGITATAATTGEVGGLVGRMESGSVASTYAIGAVREAIKGGLIGKLGGACTG